MQDQISHTKIYPHHPFYHIPSPKSPKYVICHQFLDISNLYCWIFSSYTLHVKLNKIIQRPNWPATSFWNLKSLNNTWFHPFLFVFICFTTRCHSLSLVVIFLSLVVIHCHLLYYSLLLVVIRCATLFH